MIVIPPAFIEEAPMPHNTRPIIKILDEAAVAQTIEPISKIAIAQIKPILISKYVYNFPKDGRSARRGSRYELVYHPMSSIL